MYSRKRIPGLSLLLVAVMVLCVRAEEGDVAPEFTGRLEYSVQKVVDGLPPGLSGVMPLSRGVDALAARLALIEAAKVSLDFQYYIWRNDTSGGGLGRALWAAANRGVKVRILIDDWGANGGDGVLMELDAHPNVEVRIFNPVVTRRAKFLGFLLNFSRTNRRMHNKAMVADSALAIIGGRNIGDEYFGQQEELDFGDVDLLTCGPVSRELDDSFETYWNSKDSHPLGKESAPAQELPLAPPEALSSEFDRTQLWSAVRNSDFLDDLVQMRLPLVVARARAVYDSPEKVNLEPGDSPEMGLSAQLASKVRAIRKELVIVSPYFVPGKGGVETLAHLCKQGVRVVVLTNSLAATDVSAVHAGYAHYRKSLLKAGVELYELRPDAIGPKPTPKRSRFRGSARSSLHAKMVLIDRRQVFVGSMNIDPRSVHLNTENGVLVDGAELATGLATEIEGTLASDYYRVELHGGALRWVSLREGVRQEFAKEQGGSFWQRTKVRLMSILPLERFL